MLTKRVIPCLDVHDGKVTRGVQFGRAEDGGLRNVGDPVELAVIGSVLLSGIVDCSFRIRRCYVSNEVAF